MFAQTLRMVVLLAIRGVAVFLILSGLSFLAREMGDFMFDGISTAALVYGLAVTTALFFGPAIILAWGSRPITHWLVPPPRGGCLFCGYDTRGAALTRCPECGKPMAGGGG